MKGIRYYCEMCLPGVGLPLFSPADAFFSTGTVGGVASQFILSNQTALRHIVCEQH